MVDCQNELLRRQVLEARVEERKHIARELHDHIIQALVGLNYQLADLRAHPEPDSDMRLGMLQADLRQVLDDVRGICSNLRPSALQDQGLVAAVQSYVRELESQAPFHVVLEVVGDPEQWLDADASLCIFRVLQEALTNVLKHANARQVTVRLLICPDEVSLVVKDDGVGFRVPRCRERLLADRRFGLIGMRERLELVHGTLEMTSAPGQGTSIYAWIPVRQRVHRQMVSDEVSYE